VAKAALDMMMLSWYWVLKEDGVKVWCVSPGYLATGLGGSRAAASRRGAGHPSVGGKLIVDVVEGRKDDSVGKIVSLSGVQAF
jgi:NAD(P)-dependent dehydrogenase (short-subunit alcohol dehydrogenase family)